MQQTTVKKKHLKFTRKKKIHKKLKSVRVTYVCGESTKNETLTTQIDVNPKIGSCHDKMIYADVCVKNYRIDVQLIKTKTTTEQKEKRVRLTESPRSLLFSCTAALQHLIFRWLNVFFSWFFSSFTDSIHFFVAFLKTFFSICFLSIAALVFAIPCNVHLPN